MAKPILLSALLALVIAACAEHQTKAPVEEAPDGAVPGAHEPDAEVPNAQQPDAAAPDEVEPSDEQPDADVPEGLEPLKPCDVLDGDHADAVCADGACPIARDVVLRCDDWEFAYFGLRVAPTRQGATLVTTSGDRTFLLEAGEGDSALSALPVDDPRQTVQLVQDAEGTVFLASNTRREAIDEAGRVSKQTLFTIAHREASAWVEEITNTAGETRWFDVISFEIDSTGAKHLWFESYDQPFVWAKQTPPAAYAYTDIDADTVDEFPRWTLTPGDEPVALSMTYTDGDPNPQLHATIGDTQSNLGRVSMYPSFVPYRIVSPAVGLVPSAESPSVAVVLQQPDGLELAWIDAEGESRTFVVPETAYLVPSCNPDWSASDCGPDCPMKGASIDGDVFAAARSRDGRAWLAWIDEQIDVVHEYSRPCDGSNFECMCQTEVTGEVLHTLRVASFDFATSALVDVLQLPIPAVARGTSGWSEPDARFLDLRAFEDKLAIGVALARPSSLLGHEVDVRLIQLDLATP